jgi:hypothetical protein
METGQAKVKQQLRPIRPSILIGLGGTGQRIVLEVRRRIIQEYGDLERLPIVGSLVIDTDIEKPIIPGVDEDTLRKIQLAPSEFFHAGVTGTEKIKQELNSYPHLAEWVDKAILERGDVTVGAKGIRAIGRLAYFLNFPNIKKAFNTIRSQVTDQPNLRYMAETHGIQVATGLNVFIVTSVCGGTGSGMFLDLAFTIKDLLTGTEHNRIGYLVLPGVFGTDMAKAAGYAALRELNHYQMDREFEANWENENSSRILQPPPFDFCYLVNNTNGKISFHQKEHLFEMIAHNIFLEFAHEFGQYKSSLKDNVQASAIGTDKLGCPLNYISVGLSTIAFPRERIITGCSFRLAKEVVDRWLSNKGDVGRINEYIDHFLDYNKLYIDIDSARKNQLKEELLKIQGGGNYYARIDDEMGAIVRGLKTQKPELYHVFIERKEEELDKKFYEGDRDPSRWGEFFRGVHKNRELKKTEVSKLLVETISKMMQNEKEGIDYAKEFLSSLEDRLIQYRDYCRAKFDELSKAESSFGQGKLKEYESLKALRNAFVFDKKRVMMDQVDKLTNTRSGKLTIYFKRKIDKKVLEIMIDLEDELSNCCRAFIKEIDQLKEKLSKIQRSLGESEKTLTLDTSGIDVYSLTLYEPGDTDKYYNDYVRSRDKEMDRNTASMIGESALKILGLENLFDLKNSEISEKAIKEALIEASRPTFIDLKHVTVAKKFLEKYPTESEQMMALRNVFASSEVFLNFRHVPDFSRLPNSKVSLIGVHEGRQPGLPEFQELLPLLEKSCTEPEQLRGIRPILQKDEVIFTTEEGAFPLRMINEMEDYESKYDKLSQGYQNPLHLRKDDKDFLIEIIQPTETEQKKARISTYIGFALGLLKPDPDDPDYIIYNYRDPRTGFVENKPLGKINEEERIIDTLLHRFNKDLRNIIFTDVDRRLRTASGNNIEKGKIWHNINKYREDYLKRRDRDFVNKRGIPELFKEVIEEYRLFDPSFVEEGV